MMSEAEYLPENIAFTENGRPCLKESGDGCLDFFFQAVPGITKDEFSERFAGAWREDPLIALRLVFQLGNCRRGDGGKLDRVNFLRGLMEVWKVDPDTLLLNVREIAAQGCYKTLLDLLQEVLWGSFEANLAAAGSHKSHREQIRQKHAKGERRKEKEARQAALKFAFAHAEDKELNELYLPFANSLLGTRLRRSSKRNVEGEELWRGRNRGEWVSNEVRDRFYKFIREREQSLQTTAKEKRLARKDEVAARVAGMTKNEKRLYNAVAAIFAEDLAKDRQQQIAVAAGTQISVSGLAAKWAPSPDGMHDRNTLMVDAIIALLDEQVLNTKGSTPRIRYQQMCAEVRSAAKIPESFIGRGEWNLVDYQRMPSVCRKVYGERLFKKHDEERYVNFLGDAVKAVQDGEKPKVHSGALLPHTVTESAKADSVEADLQWHGLVMRLIQARSSQDDDELVVPVCDVSGSMTGEPMEVAIALSLLLAESAPKDSPVFGKIFTFHDQPQLLTVPNVPDHAAGEMHEGGLAERVEWVRNMDWGMNTNFDAVMDMLLELCIQHALPPERAAAMKVCVFSDMQFDEARGYNATPWETAHESLVRRWQDAGYPSAPRIVYWNLRATQGVPVKKNEEGVVMLSGFSSSLLEAFMAGNMDKFSPVVKMLELLEKECYLRLRLSTQRL